MAYVYIVRCCDDTYYVGMTQSLRGRIKAHKDGKGAVWTKERLPVELVYSVVTTDPSDLEKKIKKLSRKEKEKLIKSWSGYPNERIQCNICDNDLTDNTAIASITYPVDDRSSICHHYYFCDFDCLKKFAQKISKG